MVAEFHDIGKLIDWKAVGLQKQDAQGNWESEVHDFQKCIGPEWGIDFMQLPWQGIFRKGPEGEGVRKAHWPDSLNWIYVSIADELASGFGRGLAENEIREQPIFGRYSLWIGEQVGDPRLKREQDLRNLIEFLNRSPTWGKPNITAF